MLARELNVVEGDVSSSLPLLAEIMRRGGGEKLSRTAAAGSEVPPLQLTHVVLDRVCVWGKVCVWGTRSVCCGC